MDPNPLELGKLESTRLTAEILELCEEYRTTLSTRRVWTVPDREALNRFLRSGIPEAAVPWEETKATLRDTIFANQGHLAHPRFFAFISSPNNLVSNLADLLASVYNPFAGNWLNGSGAETVERTLIAWLAREIGLPDDCGGVFYSGGSISNLSALVAARHWRFHDTDWRAATIYFSDQTHSSVLRAARILGFAPNQLRVVPTGDDFRLSLPGLRATLDADHAAGLTPFCIIANAGTTNTGAVDPFAELKQICDERRMWLHVDGAFGGAASLCDEGKAILEGLQLADSITLDPHKWLFQPFPCSCLLVRRDADLRRAFHTGAEYLEAAEGEWNLYDYGPELTRPFRALKLWLSLQVFGAAAFRLAIARGFHLARYAEECLRKLEDWEVTSPATMGVVTFRYAPAGAAQDAIDAINHQIADRCAAEGFAFLVTTRIKGRRVLRLCPINPRTTDADIAATIDHLSSLANRLV